MLYICLLMKLMFCLATDDMSGILSNYEVINVKTIRHRVRRQVAGDSRFIDFNAFKRHFKLTLDKPANIFSETFSAYSVDKYGNKTSIYIDKSAFYEGYLDTDISSHVVAHLYRDLILATIDTNSETYLIEPMPNSQDELIIYRASDVKTLPKTPSSCGVKQNINRTSSISNKRNKRMATNGIKNKNCEIALVGDYLFYENIGKRDKQKASSYMLQVISSVNKIFRQTEWPGIGNDIGFTVKEVLVHDEYSSEQHNRYNLRDRTPAAEEMLTYFSQTKWKDVCVAHLFTYTDFPNGVLGLANVATVEETSGGICAKGTTSQGASEYRNTGLSSYLNYGRNLLAVESYLLTAHELGHNFGSNHDENVRKECIPDKNGRFVMYPNSVTGDEVNNKLFSPCSREQVARVLEAKSHLCFVAHSGYCGNGFIDGDEECDPGQEGDDDVCCNECKLGKDAQCSKRNHACCKECKIADNDFVCRDESQLYCAGRTLCNGVNKTCPNAPGLTNNKSCGISQGQCKGGKCLSLCVINGFEPCVCEPGVDACNLCCVKNQKCTPLTLENNDKIAKRDGSPCQLKKDQRGKCVNQKCEKYVQVVKDSFNEMLRDFSLSAIGRFMKANIVGSILVLSLIIWIPLGCIVNYLERKEERELEEMRLWNDPRNNRHLLRFGPKLKDIFTKGSERRRNIRTQFHISS